MKVKIKYHDIIGNTDIATLFLISSKEFWIPNSIYNFAKQGNYLIVDEWYPKKNNISYKKYLHIPQKLEIQASKKPINELIYEHHT